MLHQWAVVVCVLWGTVLVQVASQSEPKVDGAWGAWGAWSACGVTCGQGQRYRYQRCNNPPPAHGGAQCPGGYPFEPELRGQGQSCVKSSCPRPTLPPPQLRLVGGHDSRSGTVVHAQESLTGIFTFKKLVCHNNWDHREARVVCDMLGYTDASPIAYLSNHFNTPETQEWPYILGGLKCTGEEADIWDCPSRDVASYCKPGSNREAGVSCYAPPSPPTHTYTLHKQLVTADAARSSCASLGQALAMPKTPAQYAALAAVRYREGAGSYGTWIDLRKIPPVWVWGPGTGAGWERVQWSDWGRGEPLRRGECGAISWAGGWRDYPCGRKLWYMCQAVI